MALTSIHLKNFLAFQNMHMKPVAGVNVMIGKNGTGKTQILKTIYGTVDSMEGPVLRILAGCFKHDNKINLVVGADKGRVVIDLDDDQVSKVMRCDTVYAGERKPGDDPDAHEHLIEYTLFNGAFHSVYIPVKDMLTHAKGLTAMAEEYRDFPFDRTLTRIIRKAQRWSLKELPELAKVILPQLEEIFDGQIVIENEEFYVKKFDGRLINFAVEAEGLKKIGLLWQLLMNKSITEDSILLWDEPEANLNPEYLPKLVECLLELSRHNVQIFISTHNYMFAKYFDLRKKAPDKVAFHSLYDGENGVQCETADCFADLKHNSIMDAYNKLLNEVEGMQALKKTVNMQSKMLANSLNVEEEDILCAVKGYTKALTLLDNYDHQTIKKPQGKKPVYKMTYVECRKIIDKMSVSFKSDVFGVEKEVGKVEGIIKSVYQYCFGVEAYPSLEEKAANLLYFLIKDHPFSDGCKRIAAALFIEFLSRNNVPYRELISDGALVAITLMIAESNPAEKEIMVTLVMNILNK